MKDTIDTFKPFFEIIKRLKKVSMHDWFSFNIHICNEIRLSITIYGYGFSTGMLIYDVMKKSKK